ncbi:hypothetical protein QCM77_44235 [Bradyrhizobium sp. SSUT18]|nr:hypothetical protein [Bradyrhizobium sp. SSUT18]MDH2406794.1 hypothetical protein [Bradyrhizobium sp. SSUT18]
MDAIEVVQACHILGVVLVALGLLAIEDVVSLPMLIGELAQVDT